MKRSPIVRIQIFLLLVVAGLLVWRSTWDGPAPAGALVLSELSTGRLYSRTFELAADGRVRIEAVSSFEAESGSVMAAMPWILRREDRTTAWRPDPRSGTREGFLLRTVDTLALQAGAYDLYFTTLGHSDGSRNGAGFLRLVPHWTNDASRWMASVSPVDSVDLRVSSEEARPSTAASDVLWDSAWNGRGSNEALIVVRDGASVRLQATASSCPSGCDRVTVERAQGSGVVWEFTRENTVPAGGAEINRTFDGVVPLEPGVYRVVYDPWWHGGPDAWEVNPPTDPESWGVRVLRSEGLTLFDPWSGGEPLVAMLGVGDDQLLRTVIQVDRPALVYVDAMGELMSGGSRYDYAWIQSSEDRVRVWEQDYERSSLAGGDDSNRRSAEFLELQPGRYSVYYQSDGSHAYGSFNRAEPDHPERWGVALFLVEGSTGEPAVRVVESPRAATDELAVDAISATSADGLVVPLPPIAGEVLFAATAVRNQVHQQGTFELSRATRLRIVALGEMTRSGRYDYGWIESVGGDVVWEQSMSNTRAGGGDDRNRLFDDVVVLPEGRYVAHYQTDFSHAFGDFGAGAPTEPGAWGMRVVRMPE